MNILFVCKYNRFRSRVAEAYFNKINKNKNIKVASAGIIRGWFPLDESEVEVAKEFELNIIGKPNGLSTEMLRQQDKIIIVANNVPTSLFDEVTIADNKDILANKEGKTLVWDIQDEKKGRKENIRKIIKSIISKIDKLVEELKEVK